MKRSFPLKIDTKACFAFFFQQNIALPYALISLLALGLIKTHFLGYLYPTALLLLCFHGLNPKKTPYFLLFFTAICIYGHISRPVKPLNSVHGVGTFVPKEIKTYSSHYKKSQYARGYLKNFHSDEGIKYKKIPCSIPMAQCSLQSMHSHIQIHATLTPKDEKGSYYRLSPDKDTPIQKVPRTLSLASIQAAIKAKLSHKLKTLFTHRDVSDLMCALTLGDLESRMLKYDFGRLGLQHILAISGFHFGLIALFLGAILRWIVPKQLANALLLCALTLYFLLLGPSPSILRAYLALTLYIIAKMASFSVRPINILSVALLLEVALNPEVIAHVGFQLSFLATFALLHLSPFAGNYLLRFFPYRTDLMALEFNVFEKACYLICCGLRSSLSLTLAINVALLPLCLLHFHTFPVAGLIYNLFLPLGFSFSLFLLLVSLIFSALIPPIGSWVAQINDSFTHFLLSMISHSPLVLDVYITTAQIKALPVIFFLLALIFLPFIKRSPNLQV